MTSVQQFNHPLTGRLLGVLLLMFLSAGAFAQGRSDSGSAAVTTSGIQTASEGTPTKVNYSNKWRLRFSGGAESDGAITLKFIPKEGEAVVAETPITKGTSENSVAQAVVKSLKAQLNKKVYKVERDDGEDVLVKKGYKAQDFGIEIVANTVTGVKISPKKE